MKKLFKVLAIIILIILIIMVVIPFAFHKQIIDEVTEEANENLNATIEFSDYNLSLFRSFPNFNLKLENLKVMGKDEFKDVKLADIPSFYISIDLISFFDKEPFRIKKIHLARPDINLLVLNDGKTNWDIFKKEEEEESEKGTVKSTEFHLALQDLIITEAKLKYYDKITETYLKADGLYHRLKGDLNENLTRLKVYTMIEQLALEYDGIEYLHNNELEFESEFEADLKNSIFTFKRNKLRLNALILEFAGSIAMVENGYDMLLTFKAKRNDFKNFISLIPAIYAKDFDNIDTKGKLTLEGSFKGTYSEDGFPTYDIRIDVEDGMFHYPDLPDKVENVNIKANIYNNTSDANNMIIKASPVHFEMAGNPVDIDLALKDLITDPDIDIKISGRFDMSSIDKIYPLDRGEKITGEVSADITLKGKLSSLEMEEYQDFKAMGSLLVNDMEYTTIHHTEGLSIKSAQVNFAPSYADIVTFSAASGENDINAVGKLENYLVYLFGDGLLKGELKAESKYFNLDDFIEGESKEEELLYEDTIEFTVYEVPENIDLTMNIDFKELVFGDMDMKNVTGELRIKDEMVWLHSLRAEMLGGIMEINGSYSTKETNRPAVDFDLEIDTFNIPEAYTAFSLVRTYVPFAKRTNGDISGNLSFNANLDENYMPVFSTFNGKGGIQSSKVEISGMNTLNILSDSLNINVIKDASISDLSLSFKIDEGKLNVKPFNFNLAQIDATLSGWTSFDQKINYNMGMRIPRKLLGEEMNNYLTSLDEEYGLKETGIMLGEYINITTKITGTTRYPDIKIGFGDAFKSDVEDMKSKVKEVVEEKKEEVKKMTKEEAQKILDEADKKAQKLLNEANAQAEKIRKEADKAASKVRKEADENAEQLIAEGKKKGALAEAAAKTAAKKLRDEAKDKADKIINEADKQAKNIIKEAQVQADKIKAEAQKKVEGK